MASTNVIADFAKRPPAFKAAVFAAVAVVLGALYYQFLYKGIRRDIKAAEDAKTSLIAEQTKIKGEITEYNALKEQESKLQDIIKNNANALPTRAQLPGFFDLVNLQAKAAGVQVRRWDYEKELPVEDVFKVPVEIQIAGTYFQIEHFFYLLYKVSQKEVIDDDDAAPAPAPTPTPAGSGSGSASGTGSGGPTVGAAAATASKLKVEDRGRILTIENLVIEEPEMTKDGLIMTATFRASTFRKEPVVAEEDPKAKAKADKAAKAKADKASKKKGLGGVKDTVQDAVDKSDDRTRKAGGDDSTLPADRDDQPEAEGVDGVKKGM